MELNSNAKTSWVWEPFRILTATLLTLLLPLSFLLLSRLSTAHYLLSVSDNLTPPPDYFLWSFLVYTKKPTILHLIVSIISVSSLTDALTGNAPRPSTRRRLYIAWVFLFLLQLCVGVGIEGSIAAGIEGSGFGAEKSLVCRMIFFLGLHETTLFWGRTVVKPVVDDTIFGCWRKEGRVEKVVVGLSYGGIWWWRLREEVEALVMVAEVKREMMMGIGVVDFVGWWLYYLTLTIGMVRLVRDFILTLLIFTRRKPATRPNDHKEGWRFQLHPSLLLCALTSLLERCKRHRSAADALSLCTPHAQKLISRCLWIASTWGTPAQRLSFYFAQSLQHKILHSAHAALALGTNPTFLASHQDLPFTQVVQLAGIQAIIDNLNTQPHASNIHFLDLQIRSGVHCTSLMQALAELSIKRLKITAIRTACQRYVEETGNRLKDFADSLNLPFVFEAVYLTEMKSFTEDLLHLDPDETLVVYSHTILRTMLWAPQELENIMRAISRLKPAVMVVAEVEANHNSSSFIDRFTESLVFYSAYFDCLEECMDRNDPHRRTLEGTYFGQGIMNTVAADGNQRVNRNVKVEVWRAFFKRFGMKEMELSESSKYQASLILTRFDKGSSCNLYWDGKGMIVGWKGTSLLSLTAWNFS